MDPNLPFTMASGTALASSLVLWKPRRRRAPTLITENSSEREFVDDGCREEGLGVREDGWLVERVHGHIVLLSDPRRVRAWPGATIGAMLQPGGSDSLGARSRDDRLRVRVNLSGFWGWAGPGPSLGLIRANGAASQQVDGMLSGAMATRAQDRANLDFHPGPKGIVDAGVGSASKGPSGKQVAALIGVPWRASQIPLAHEERAKAGHR